MKQQLSCVVESQSSCVVESMVEGEGRQTNVHIASQTTVKFTWHEAEVKKR
jgi:hypothetical protein